MLGSMRLCGVLLLASMGLALALAGVAAAAKQCATGGVATADPSGAGSGPRADLEHGNRLAAAGDVEAALVAYEQSRRAALANGDPSLAILAAANAVRASIDAGRLAGIESRLAAVLAQAEQLPDAAARPRLLIHIARSYARLAEGPPGSLAARRRAAEILARAEEQAQRSGDVRLRSYALGYRAELYERAGRLDEALALNDSAMLTALVADAPEALFRWQWQAGRIQHRGGRVGEALLAYRQAGATLRDLRSQAALAGAGWSDALGANVDDLYLEFVDLLLSSANLSRKPEKTQALLREARDTLEARKADELQDYFRDECLAAQRKATPDEVPGAVVVYPVVLDDRLELIVSVAGRFYSRVSPVGREELTQEVRSFRHKLTRRTTREHMRHAHVLYDWLIRPIEPLLREHEPNALVFVPDGPLRTIPFAALRDRESGRYLIEQYPIAIVPSLTLTDPRPIQRGQLRALAVGLSEAVAGFPALDYVEAEIDALGEVFPSQKLLNVQFEVDRFQEEIEKRPFGIVHIASHAEISEDASESFLLAYDGMFSMDRLAEMVGTTRFRQEQPLELLTLSACETAAGNQRAGLGLAGIALRAGARSALATLWSVNDQSSAQLIIEFYHQLGKPEVSRAEALRRAQLKLLGQRGYRHPAFWSAFVMISSWL